MEHQEFNIKPQDLKFHCCTCLNKLSGYQLEVGNMTHPLFPVYKQCTGHKNMRDDLYSKCVCAQCYEKLEIIDEFQRMAEKTMVFLEELMKSFKSELNSRTKNHAEFIENKTCSNITDVSLQSEIHPLNIEKDLILCDDPLLCYNKFEQVLIKPEIMEEDQLLDLKHCMDEVTSSVPNEERTLNDGELALQKNKQRFQCNKCELSFNKKVQLKDHLIEEHDESPAPKIDCKFGCGKSFSRTQTAENHYNKSHQSFLDKNESEQIETIQQGKMSAKVVSLKTKINEKLQQLGCSLTTDIKQEIKLENETDGAILSTTKTTCPICHKIFCSVSGLNVHMRVHLDVRPFQCPKCDRGFNKRALLTNHLKEAHADVPIEIVCKYGCGRVFQRQDSAMNHYRLKHILPAKGIKKDYTRVCEDCGKVFKNISILKEHRNIHLPPEQRPYKCDQCGKRFSMKKNLTMHLMRHAGIKNFECTVCGLKTTTRRELRLHMNFHTKELRVECPVCSKVFNSPSNMKRHEQVVHQGIKKYSCRFCDETFGKPDTLKHHEMRHTGERPHKCEICNRAFIQLVALKAHMKTHNKLGKMQQQEQQIFGQSIVL